MSLIALVRMEALTFLYWFKSNVASKVAGIETESPLTKTSPLNSNAVLSKCRCRRIFDSDNEVCVLYVAVFEHDICTERNFIARAEDSVRS